jgi:hypothetical protein
VRAHTCSTVSSPAQPSGRRDGDDALLPYADIALGVEEKDQVSHMGGTLKSMEAVSHTVQILMRVLCSVVD